MVNSKKIGCVIILYNPDDKLLRKVIDAVVGQVNEVCVIDNSPEPGNRISKFQLTSNICYIPLGENYGIASAQNKGIQYFSEKGYSHVILLDQDSIMEENQVKKLWDDLESLNQKSIKVGAIGPRPFHRQRMKAHHGKINIGKKITNNITEVTELISSGSLIPLTNFTEVGLLDETLFIDGVDHEWCWRASHENGFRFFISEKTHLNHMFGEGDKFFLIRYVAIPTPFRTYYQFRNYFLLLSRKYVPFYWKLSNGLKYFVKLIYFPLFLKPRKAYFCNICKGILDGINYNRNLSHPRE